MPGTPVVKDPEITCYANFGHCWFNGVRWETRDDWHVSTGGGWKPVRYPPDGPAVFSGLGSIGAAPNVSWGQHYLGQEALASGKDQPQDVVSPQEGEGR